MIYIFSRNVEVTAELYVIDVLYLKNNSLQDTLFR